MKFRHFIVGYAVVSLLGFFFFEVTIKLLDPESSTLPLMLVAGVGMLLQMVVQPALHGHFGETQLAFLTTYMLIAAVGFALARIGHVTTRSLSLAAIHLLGGLITWFAILGV